MEKFSTEIEEFCSRFEQTYASVPTTEEVTNVITSVGFTQQFIARGCITSKYGFGLPTIELGDRLKTKGIVDFVSVGTGSGFFDSVLSKTGINIVSTDLAEPESNKYSQEWAKSFVDIEYGLTAEEAVKKYNDKNLLMVWPCYDTNWAYKALEALESGKYCLYVGEGYGGCNADDDFFRCLEEDFIDILGDKYIEYPNWYGINDYPRLYQKK